MEKSKKSVAEMFEEILQGAADKKQLDDEMIKAVDEAMNQIRDEISEYGEIIIGHGGIEECPCQRKCGALKITVEFSAFAFQAVGIRVTEGTITKVVKRKQ